ncbi:MAG: IclR family transcriptional regulator [Acidobacteria bacterium]|nr:MAG: IclR family transcriptional regulator [Acidobacteriota bacterium]REK05628.1 MAG: IclR family transcriptional regulator [Acidobacteriota bacterium]
MPASPVEAKREGARKRASGRETTTSVERALSILEAVAEVEQGLTHAELSRTLGIPKSTATYLLRTLEGRGYLRKNADSGRFQVGVKILGLGQHALAGRELPRIAQPHLRRLAEETQLTVHLAILDHDRPVYVARADLPGFVKINTWVGRELPLHSTAVGKVLVAGLDEERRERLLEGASFAPRTGKTITDPARFRDEIAAVLRRGWAIDDEENNLGVRCVAVPVFDARGAVDAALGASGTTSLFPRERIAETARRVQATSREISSQLGFEL